MRKIIFLLLLSFTGEAFAQNTYVPDDNFEQALIDLGYDTLLNDSVPTANIQNVVTLNIIGKGIADLTGIEDFSALEVLHCGNNQISVLDLSQNTMLRNLSCTQNPLTDLNISTLSQLQTLSLSQTLLTSLDLSQNPNLTYLYCANNSQLSSLNITQNTALTQLRCFGNQLTTLNVSQNTALTDLNCAFNQLTSIDVSNNTNLEVFNCIFNQITQLDLSQNTLLETIQCRNNQLTSLNVRNGNNNIITQFNSTNNPDLTCIEVDDPAWSSANWTNIDSQQYFSADCSTQSVDNEEVNVGIFPNPASEYFIVNTPLEIGRVSITDLSGKTVKTYAPAHRYELEELPEGIYFVRIQLKRTGRSVNRSLIIR